MLSQTFTQEFYYLSYLVNQSAFEKNCINKAKTWLHCNGKCQLMKKIVEHEKKEQQTPEMKLAGKTEVLSSSSFYAILPPSPIVIILRQYINHEIGSATDQPSSFFHPPTA
jgi:hypothetical protein